MMDNEDTMQGETGATTDTQDTGQADDKEDVSVFLPKAALHGEQCKPGDTITLKVKDVDPETGDVEAVCDYSNEDEKSEGGMMDDFDQAMPPEQG
jgi:hypothetical protein